MQARRFRHQERGFADQQSNFTRAGRVSSGKLVFRVSSDFRAQIVHKAFVRAIVRTLKSSKRAKPYKIQIIDHKDRKQAKNKTPPLSWPIDLFIDRRQQI